MPEPTTATHGAGRVQQRPSLPADSGGGTRAPQVADARRAWLRFVWGRASMQRILRRTLAVVDISRRASSGAPTSGYRRRTRPWRTGTAVQGFEI